MAGTKVAQPYPLMIHFNFWLLVIFNLFNVCILSIKSHDLPMFNYEPRQIWPHDGHRYGVE